MPDDSIDLICTHPPYANIIKYSDGMRGDFITTKSKRLSQRNEKRSQQKVIVYLKRTSFVLCLWEIQEQKGHMIPMSFDVMRIFENAGSQIKRTYYKRAA